MSGVPKQDRFNRMERKLERAWTLLLGAALDADSFGFWGVSEDLEQIRIEVERVQHSLLSGRTRNSAVRRKPPGHKHVSESGYLRDGS